MLYMVMKSKGAGGTWSIEPLYGYVFISDVDGREL